MPLDKWLITLENTKPILDTDPILANDKFNNWVEGTLDSVLPKTSMLVHNGPNRTAWYTPKLRELKQSCKRLERIWRQDFSQSKKKEYREAINLYKMEIKKAQASYFEETITQAANSPRETFRIAKKLLKIQSPQTLP